MDITLEKSHHGSDALPLGLYRQSGTISGNCITPLHYHKDLELILTLEGSTTLVLDGEVLETRPNVIYFINPYQIHSMHISAPPSRYDCLVIPLYLISLPEGHAAMANLVNPIFNGEMCFVGQTEDPYLIDLFKCIIKSYAQKEQNATSITAYLLLFLDYCLKHGLLKETSSLSTTPIRKAIDYIEGNFTKKISLDEISQSAGLSAKYFCTYFKKHTLTTPITYLNMVRIRHAKLLLSKKTLSVLEVALSCGFDNVSFFIRQFKSATGKTPGQYRKSL